MKKNTQTGNPKENVGNIENKEEEALSQQEILAKNIQKRKLLQKEKAKRVNEKSIFMKALPWVLGFLTIALLVWFVGSIMGNKNSKDLEQDTENVAEEDAEKKNSESEKSDPVISSENLIDPFAAESQKSSRSFYGTVFNDNTFDIYSDTSGRVLYSPKDEGEYISKGNLIVKVDDTYILDDLEKSHISKESARTSYLKLINASPDKEDFDKIDANIENIELSIANIDANIEKTKKDMELEESTVSVETIELSIKNLENQKKRTQNDIDIANESLVDSLRDLYENDVEEYFVDNSNKERVFRYLLEDQRSEENLENYRQDIEDTIDILVQKESENTTIISLDEVEDVVDLFSQYYDFLHYVSFDILLLNDDDLDIVEAKTREGKEILAGHRRTFNNYYLSLENIDSAIEQNQKQKESILLGKNQTNNALELALKSLENQKEQSLKQIELLEIDRQKIIASYVPDTEDLKLSELNIDSANANIKTLEQRLADTSIYAEVSGKIISKNIEKESYINPGSLLMTIESSDITNIKVFVPESFVKNISLGQRVVVDDFYKGKISDIENRIDAQTGNVKVEVVLDTKVKEMFIDKTVRVNMSFVSRGETMDIPLASVAANINGDNFVYVQDEEGEIVERAIEIENFKDTEVEVHKKFFEEGDLILNNKSLASSL